MRQFVPRNKCFKTPRQELTYLKNEVAWNHKRGVDASPWIYDRIKELEAMV